jgi:uncharacterized iron-regulated membrane protein
MHDVFAGVAIATIVWVVVLIATVFAAVSGNERHWQRAAIQHNSAHYDPKTAAFKWNDEP